MFTSLLFTHGISRVSSLHCFMCMQLVYLNPRDVHRRVWPCTSALIFQLGCLRPRILRCCCHVPVTCWRSVSPHFQLCVTCRRNTLMSIPGASILADTCQMSVMCRLFQLYAICRRNTLMIYLVYFGRYVPDVSENHLVSIVAV